MSPYTSTWSCFISCWREIPGTAARVPARRGVRDDHDRGADALVFRGQFPNFAPSMGVGHATGVHTEDSMHRLAALGERYDPTGVFRTGQVSACDPFALTACRRRAHLPRDAPLNVWACARLAVR